MKQAIKQIIHELKHHVPFTFFATFIAVLIAIVFYNTNIPEKIFDSIHSIHVLASAIVTSAIFYKYKENYFQAFLVGIFGAIIMGSLSDIIFPYIGAIIFQLETEFHLPIIEGPLVILSSAIIGSVIGIKTKYTKIPHLIHVSLSVFASLFYLITFSQIDLNILHIISVSTIIFLTVIIPCCLSDIIFPFLFLGENIKNCDCK